VIVTAPSFQECNTINSNFVKFMTKKAISIQDCNKINTAILSSLIIILHDPWIMHTIYKCNAIILNQQRQHPVQYLHTFIQIIYATLILPNNIYASTKNLDIWNAGLTTLAKNRETWLLPPRPWGRSEGMTGRLPTAS